MKLIFYLLIITSYMHCTAMEIKHKVLVESAFTHAVEQNKLAYFNELCQLVPLSEELANSLLVLAEQKGHRNFLRPLTLKRAESHYEKGAEPKLGAALENKDAATYKDDLRKLNTQIDEFWHYWQDKIQKSYTNLTLNKLLEENKDAAEKRIQDLIYEFFDEHSKELAAKKVSYILLSTLFKAVTHQLLIELATKEKKEAPQNYSYEHLLLINTAIKNLSILAGQDEITTQDLLPLLISTAKKELTYHGICLIYTIACRSGNVSFINALLNAHILPTVQEPTKLNSPLMEAIVMGHPEVVTLLLTHRTTKEMVQDLLRQRNRQGETPLIIACLKDHRDLEDDVFYKTDNEKNARRLLTAYAAIINLLLNNNAPINETDNKGRSAFVHAVLAQHMPIIELLLNHPRCNKDNKPQDPDQFKPENSLILNFQNDNKRTPLMLVCMEKTDREDTEPIKILFQKEAALNDSNGSVIKDIDGFTPYLHAAAKGNHKIMKEIAQKMRPGEIRYETNNQNENGLHLACKNGHAAAANAFLNDLPTAYDSRSKKYLRSGAWNDDTHIKGLNALCLAAFYGHNNVINTLLNFAENNNKTPSQNDLINWTWGIPLKIAMRAKQYETAELLRINGALPLSNSSLMSDPNDRMSPIEYAARDGQLELLKRMLMRCKLNEKNDPNIYRALEQAIKAGQLAVIEYLIPTYQMQVCLYVAVKAKQYEAAKLLLKLHAEPFAKNTRHKSGLDYAAKHGQIELVKLILRKQSDTAALAGEALLFAAPAGQLEMVKLLCEDYQASLTERKIIRANKSQNALQLARDAGKQEVVSYLEPKYEALTKNDAPASISLSTA